MADNPLEGLRRFDEKALGPCICCERVMLATGFPLFHRVKLERCGIDAREVQRHVGLAQAIAPGSDGLALAAIMGPKVEPVVVMDETPPFNVCHECAGRQSFMAIVLHAMAAAEERVDG